MLIEAQIMHFLGKRAMITASLLSLSLCMGNCRTISDHDSQTNLSSIEDGVAQRCVALRGNGNWVGTHFGSLARIVNDFGVVDGMAGGSSSTITAFIYESILLNPAITPQNLEPSDDDIRPADQEVMRRKRISLLLKSAYGFLASTRKEIGEAVTTSVSAARNILKLRDNLASLQFKDVNDLLQQLESLERKFQISGIIDDEMKQFILSNPLSLEGVKNLDFKRQELFAAFDALGKFNIDDKSVFFRPGLINFKTFAKVIGSFGDYYAGRFFSDETKKEFNEWLDRCSVGTEAMPWSQLNFNKCADDFYNNMNRYLREYAQNRAQSSEIPRVSERLGSSNDLRVMISTSVLNDTDLIGQYETARALYLKGDKTQVENFSISFNENNTPLGFGYWGPNPQFNEEVRNNLNQLYPKDAKTRKFVSLDSSTWDNILQLSPAEPGLAPMKPAVPGGRSKVYSLGGWADLHPVQVLRAMNCDPNEIIYITRDGQESDMALGASRVFGADEQLRANLYYTDGMEPDRLFNLPNSNLNEATGTFKSSYEQAIADSSVWCTDWNGYKEDQVLAMSDSAFLRTPFFAKAGSSYSNARDPKDTSKLYPNLANPNDPIHQKKVACYLKRP